MTEPIDPRYGGRLLNQLDRGVYAVEVVAAATGGIMIFIVMWIGVAQIVIREVFNRPLYVQLDLIHQTLCPYALLPISSCSTTPGNIPLDSHTSRIPGPPP